MRLLTAISIASLVLSIAAVVFVLGLYMELCNYSGTRSAYRRIKPNDAHVLRRANEAARSWDDLHWHSEHRFCKAAVHIVGAPCDERSPLGSQEGHECGHFFHGPIAFNYQRLVGQILEHLVPGVTDGRDQGVRQPVP